MKNITKGGGREKSYIESCMYANSSVKTSREVYVLLFFDNYNLTLLHRKGGY